MMYQPYALQSCRARELYGVRIGGCGGRILARDWGLNHDQAARLCDELQRAYDTGRESTVAA